jgi:hypothetical protein
MASSTRAVHRELQVLQDAIEFHAEVVALKGLFEDPLFLADCLQRLLTKHPDLQLLVRHVHEQLAADGRYQADSPMG